MAHAAAYLVASLLVKWSGIKFSCPFLDHELGERGRGEGRGERGRGEGERERGDRRQRRERGKERGREGGERGRKEKLHREKGGTWCG